MTAQLTQLIVTQDNRTIVRDKIAQILLEERDAQIALATTSASIAYTRADESDYTVVATQSGLAQGVYTATAGTLAAGVGTWTLQPPGGGDPDTCTTEAADDPLVFAVVGLTLTVTDWNDPFETGDVVTVTVVDPEDYQFRVYTGRVNLIASWLEAPDQADEDARPIVHIDFERHNFERGKSDVTERQHGPARFMIDVYGYGTAKATDAGHDSGEVAAEAKADWAMTLVRQILLAAHYTYLGLQGTVSERWPEGIEFFRPSRSPDSPPIQNIAAYRLTLEVAFSEYSPQVVGVPLEMIVTTVYREEDGEVLLTETQDWS